MLSSHHRLDGVGLTSRLATTCDSNAVDELVSERRLATKLDYDTDVELAQLELLKLRFGESALHHCEVMLRDFAVSKRVNAQVCCGIFSLPEPPRNEPPNIKTSKSKPIRSSTKQKSYSC